MYTKRSEVKEGGITLIALVITIIVLLILAGVSIATLTGPNGLLTQAQEASIETVHAAIYEQLKIKNSEYYLEKETGKYKGNLIDYLKDEKNVIKEISDVDGYVIDVVELMGEKQRYGNGTDGKTDVYKLEEVVEASKITELNKVATITSSIKIGEAGTTSEKYKVTYYGKTASENKELGILEDNNEKDDGLITFTIDDISSEKYNAKKGMTWRDWLLSEYNTQKTIYLNDSGELSCTYETESAHYRLRYVLEGQSFEVKNADELIIDNCHYVVAMLAECVYPNSEILVSIDGETKEAKELREGESIVYYNFRTKQTEVGKVEKVYIHKDATNFVRYEFEDGSYLEATDYHPIYTKEGWKSLTQRNGYEVPKLGDEVKTDKGWKKLVKIEEFEGKEDCYDFAIKTKDGEEVNNYFANGTLVEGSY